MDIPLIEFKDVTKRFNGKVVFDKLNFAIQENQITTIIGKSGSGKSVLLKHIIGLLSPDAGTIYFKGKPVQEMKASEWDSYRRRISYMFQGNALFDSMTVFENIALPLMQTTDLNKKEIEQKVMSRIEQMEIADAAHQYPSALSGGMQKRVALARALVTDPTVVLFDEPTTGQDPIRKNAILSMVAHYRKRLGFTAVLISHDIPDVFFISDRILLLWEGKIGFSGSYGELSRFKHPLMDEFLRSLQGLQDELTGLLSREIFRSRYATTLGGEYIDTITAVLFSVKFELLDGAFVPHALGEVLKSLGQYVNAVLGPLGAFSVRHSHDEILSILPRIDSRKSAQLVRAIGRDFQNKALPALRDAEINRIGTAKCFEISVSAGMQQGSSADDIEEIIAKAGEKKVIIAKYRCTGEQEVA